MVLIINREQRRDIQWAVVSLQFSVSVPKANGATAARAAPPPRHSTVQSLLRVPPCTADHLAIPLINPFVTPNVTIVTPFVTPHG